MRYKLNILGTRGVPAAYGGFETFAERLSLFLVDKGWEVTVYCQSCGRGSLSESFWKGIRRVEIPVRRDDGLGSMMFDWKATHHALSQEGIFLTLGYNTAIFNLLQRLKGQTNIINMDGIEWRRAKWGRSAKAWFWMNEYAACRIGNHLVADHPVIKEHLIARARPEKITVIPYGADEVLDADSRQLASYGVEPGHFSVVIARPEPENSLLEIVRAFSRTERGHKLLVLGDLKPERNPFHRSVMSAASDEVIFPGAIYELFIVQALRFFSRFYLHGHRVGGTNPSLVEALGAGCAIIAYDNPFNRWVAGSGAAYFGDEAACADLLDELLTDETSVRNMRAASRERFRAGYKWSDVLNEYERLLVHWYPA
ncbi:hypothetical protein AvCA_16220 [Azotobacter vinelandii CA]|uniref:DUF1972 domain-containing protein n=2 Tax=Azotobacter vinelandii TaxID=354 RepID=C1DRU9_AZOVD|nr:DUF1972 domain-containing protein [Azotobacter vinelandii]ACO77837.1 conserved hypothetical protein [Azotobacter vinelandii DJ]AGK15265.1 hypothetical protein AvCA_16220 [Azotobacter vinelandii CA]AGK20010.1 hypothetical protein AvCA6_16220 [Azotobacter vinelandii CA6]WKN23580.1 DUF1972 domain-containing protein [Azotobacter vinelandii]SFX86371.1 Glycosyltransferase involved in cell wall bisynthesis [Azotobacter vinelandii]